MRRTTLLLTVLVVSANAANAQASAHRSGPDGLEGWLVSETVEALQNQGPLPTELVISQHGKIIRHLVSMRPTTRKGPDEGPFFWNLIFLPDSKRVAYENGPLHFGVECTLWTSAQASTLQTSTATTSCQKTRRSGYERFKTLLHCAEMVKMR